MIGVLCRDSDREIVQEFFQLFKTPWEFYREGAKYQVVISSVPLAQDVDADLLIFYNSLSSSFDVQNGLSVESSVSGRFPFHDGTNVPIYGKLASLQGVGDPLVHDKLTHETFAIKFPEGRRQRLRVGYDLLQEIAFLLTEGQPVESAVIPTIELHISLLRNWIISAGIPLVEIPPIPYGFNFFVCLTHDVDFVGVRRHKFDHTFWGFVYRALLGSLVAFLRGKIHLTKLLENWIAVVKLPLVFAGVTDDFWEHFDKYADIEEGLSSTFFLIPFKNRTGDNISNKNHYKRATHYDIGDIGKQVQRLRNLGFEIGLHGIDAWTSSEKGSQEMKRIVEVTGQKEVGVRMHWLYYDQQSPLALEHAGFEYDATLGYNETVGFKNGTMQAFRPIGVGRLLEIPLNIQDTALFFPFRLNLNDEDAKLLCDKLLDAACRHGGVLTASWHERSIVPERLWGDFYLWLLREIQSRKAWIGSAGQVVDWFRQRRLVNFDEFCLRGEKLMIKISGENLAVGPRMFLRFYIPLSSNKVLTSGDKYQQIDIPWNGERELEISAESIEAG